MYWAEKIKRVWWCEPIIWVLQGMSTAIWLIVRLWNLISSIGRPVDCPISLICGSTQGPEVHQRSTMKSVHQTLFISISPVITVLPAWMVGSRTICDMPIWIPVHNCLSINEICFYKTGTGEQNLRKKSVSDDGAAFVTHVFATKTLACKFQRILFPSRLEPEVLLWLSNSRQKCRFRHPSKIWLGDLPRANP